MATIKTLLCTLAIIKSGLCICQGLSQREPVYLVGRSGQSQGKRPHPSQRQRRPSQVRGLYNGWQSRGWTCLANRQRVHEAKAPPSKQLLMTQSRNCEQERSRLREALLRSFEAQSLVRREAMTACSSRPGLNGSPCARGVHRGIQQAGAAPVHISTSDPSRIDT